MNRDDKLFELMTQMYSEIKDEFKKIDDRFQMIDNRFQKVDNRFQKIDDRFQKIDDRFDKIENEVRKTNLIIENDIKPKIDILFDSHKQNTEKLNRIEAEVIKHEEFIIKRIK